MQLLRKISTRTVGFPKTEIQKLVLNDQEKSHPLFRVVGVCNGTRQGTAKDIQEEETGLKEAYEKRKTDDPMHNWTALLGQFKATNLKTGEIFHSGVCFLPNYVTDAVAGQLSDEVETVQFAFDISAKFDENSATSYIFEAQNLIPPAPENPLDRIEESLPKLIAAPAPEKEKIAGKEKSK